MIKCGRNYYKFFIILAVAINLARITTDLSFSYLESRPVVSGSSIINIKFNRLLTNYANYLLYRLCDVR